MIRKVGEVGEATKSGGNGCGLSKEPYVYFILCYYNFIGFEVNYFPYKKVNFLRKLKLRVKTETK